MQFLFFFLIFFQLLLFLVKVTSCLFRIAKTVFYVSSHLFDICLSTLYNLLLGLHIFLFDFFILLFLGAYYLLLEKKDLGDVCVPLVLLVFGVSV